MRLKKSILLFLFAFFAFNATSSSETNENTFVFAIKAGQFLNVDGDGALPATKAGILFSTNPDGGEMGDAIGIFDSRIFCDYKFKWWPGETYKSNLEMGLLLDCLCFNFGLVPLWHIEENSWDFCYRLGWHIGYFGNDWYWSENHSFFEKHSGFEMECYFQAPFNDPKAFDVVLGVSYLFSTRLK